MKILFKIFDFAFDSIKKEPMSRLGLFSAIFIVVLIFYCINKSLFCSFVLIFLVILLIIYWVLMSGRGIIPSAKYTLVFCIKTDDKSRLYFNKVLDKLKIKLDQLYILKEIRIVNVDPELINNSEQALQYSKSQRVDLVIWGTAISETRQGNEVVNFSLNSTYRLNDLLRNKMLLFKSDLNLIAGTRDWILDIDNTLTEEIKVTDNFVEAVIFISGIHLFTDNELRKALKMFLALRKMIVDMKSDQFKSRIEGRINAILTEVYILLGEDYVFKKEYKLGRQCFLELLSFNGINYFRPYVFLAKLEYLLGSLKKAKEYTSKASEINSEHPVIYLNNAFFNLIEKNYDRALYWYKKIFALSFADVDIPQLLEFFYDRYQENKKEIGLLFAMGIIDYKFSDRGRGISDLRLFLNQAKSKDDYESMVEFANAIIDTEKSRKKKFKRNKKSGKNW